MCEKEAKTKAYSKEGLTRDVKLDATELARRETRAWISTVLGTLQEQIEEFDCEMETHSTAKKTPKGTKRIAELTTLTQRSRVTLHIIPLFSHRTFRHRTHIAKLEQLLRLLENDQLAPQDVDELREDVEYYCENNQDPEFFHDETLYDSLIDEYADEAYLFATTASFKKDEAVEEIGFLSYHDVLILLTRVISCCVTAPEEILVKPPKSTATTTSTSPPSATTLPTAPPANLAAAATAAASTSSSSEKVHLPLLCMIFCYCMRFTFCRSF